METQNHLEYAKRVGYVDKENADSLMEKLSQIYSDLNKIIISYKDRA
jgi:four helix bundle protein